MKKNRLVYIIIAIIIVAGIINTFLNKFTFSLAYDSIVRMDVYIGKDYNTEDIKSLAKEVLGEEVLVQKVETFNDMAAITARNITEEQQKAIVEKINEKYESEATLENISITTIPHYNGTDLLERYKLPILISAVMIILYVAIRYKKLGSIRMASKTVVISAIVELLYVSIISLAKIPVSFYTIPLGIVIEILTLTVLMSNFEKKLEEKRIEDKKANKKIEE